MQSPLLWRWVSLVSYFSLLTLVLLWNTLLSPPAPAMVAPTLLFQGLPLMFPLRGLLHGRAYTHAWTSFLALYYFFIGVGDAYSDDVDQVYGAIMVAGSVGLFFGCMLYARFQGRADQRRIEQAETDQET